MEKQSLKALPLLALLLWIMGSCVGSEVDGEKPVNPGNFLSVQIPAGVVPLQAATPVDTKSKDETDSLATRAGEPTYARAIVLQYKGGNLLNTGKTDISTYTVGNSISAQLVAGEGCNIYVLVVNETTTSGGNASFATEDGLKAAVYDLYGKIPSPTDNDIPLVGSLTGVSVVRMTVSGQETGLIKQSGSQGAVKVELKRIAAKVKLDFRYGLAGYMADAGSGQIMNVPQAMFWLEPTGTTYPEESASFAPVSFTLSDCDGDNDDQSATSFTRYIPANKRGSVTSISRPSDKYSATAPSTKCTYITFKAKEKANASHILTYSFYLGANNTTDFNIDRNYVYTINTTISQGAKGDNRVTEEGVLPEVHTTELVQNIATTSATLSGTVGGSVAPSEYGFYYKAGTSFEGNTGATQLKASGLSGNNFSASLTGLAAKSVYYFRAYAICNGQTLYGEAASFSTNADGMPVLTTIIPPVSATDGRSAVSTGNVITGANAWGIVYATATGFKPTGEGTRTAGSGNAVTLSSLETGKDYYYYHYASNAQGYVYSSTQQAFRTKDYPSIPTGASVQSTVVDKLNFQATLPERKNAVDDYPTTAGVKLWTSNPGTLSSTATVPTPVATLNFSSPGTIGAKNQDWMGMTAGQNYFYAVFSTNGVGTVYHGTSAASFTVSAALPDPSQKSMTIGPQSKTGAFTVATTGRNTNATVSGSGPTVASGNGTASKSIDMAANTATSSRSATLTFTTTIGELPLRSNTASITQYGVVFPASFSNVTNVPKEGKAATSVSVTSNIPWQATSNVAWCSITGGDQTGANTEGGSAQSFSYTVAASSDIPRDATITIKGTGSFTSYSKTFTVSQLTGTMLQIDKNDMSQGPQKSSHKLGITSNTTWTLVSGNTAAATVGVASGSSNADVDISVKDNTTIGGSRTAIITATPAGNTAKSYTITQYGVVFPASFGNVIDVSKDGKTATNVSVTSNISWQATSDAAWCTIDGSTTTGSVHTGDNTQTGSAQNFSYTVAKNTGAVRTATITVKGTGSWTGISKAFTVSQLPGGQITINPGDPNNNQDNVDFKSL